MLIKLTTIGAAYVNFGRALFAAITVGIFIAFRKQLRFDWFIILTSLFYAGALTAVVYSNKYTTAANSIFLQYTAPIYILIFAPVLLKEKFRANDLVTVILCLVGMSMFFLDAPNAENKLATNIFAGNIAGLIAGACLGLYFTFLRHPRSLKFNPALSVFYGNIVIVVFMIPMMIVDPQAPATNDFIAISLLGIFQIGVGYIFFTYGVARGVRPLDASIIGFMEPLLNPTWVFLFVGERPGNWAIFGGLTIILAIAFHTFSRRKLKP